MYSFKKSLIALVGLLVLIGVLAALMPLVSRGQGQAPFGQRKFYLTRTTHDGNEVLTACAGATTWRRCGKSSIPATSSTTPNSVLLEQIQAPAPQTLVAGFARATGLTRRSAFLVQLTAMRGRVLTPSIMGLLLLLFPNGMPPQ